MSPLLLNEITSRRDYYRSYLKSGVGIAFAGKSDEELLKELHNYRREQYEKPADEVYEEKDYDSRGVPTDETHGWLGLDGKEFYAIVHAARERVTQ